MCPRIMTGSRDHATRPRCAWEKLRESRAVAYSGESSEIEKEREQNLWLYLYGIATGNAKRAYILIRLNLSKLVDGKCDFTSCTECSYTFLNFARDYHQRFTTMTSITLNAFT